MATWTQKEIDALYVKVMKKAATDAAFRKKLLTDTNKTLSDFAGKEIPAGFKIKIIENDPKYQKTFVLPDLVSEKMSDKDLEKVAGGACGVDFGACGAKACAAESSIK